MLNFEESDFYFSPRPFRFFPFRRLNRRMLRPRQVSISSSRRDSFKLLEVFVNGNVGQASRDTSYKRYDRGLLTIDGNSSPWLLWHASDIIIIIRRAIPGVLTVYAVSRSARRAVEVTVSAVDEEKLLALSTVNVYLIVSARPLYGITIRSLQWPTGFVAAAATARVVIKPWNAAGASTSSFSLAESIFRSNETITAARFGSE